MTRIKLRIQTLVVFAVASATARCTNTEQGKCPMHSPTSDRPSANEGKEFEPAPVVPLASQGPPRLIVDAPLPKQLRAGYVVVRYRTDNLRILPVYGPAALNILPRIGHLHITIDDLPWHWLDSSDQPISVNGLPPGPHKLLIELEGPTHKLIDSATVKFLIPRQA